MQIKLLFISPGKIRVQALDNGTTVEQSVVNPDSPRSRARFVKLGLDDRTLLGLLEKAAVTKETVVHEWKTEVDEEAPPPPPFSCLIRSIEESTGRTVTDPEAVIKELHSIPVTQVLCLTGQDIGCLDVDYHDHPAPPKAHLESWVESRLSPTPRAWHFSRSGGLHLFYTSVDGITGEELAAAASIHFPNLDPSCSVELKGVVRGPGKEKVRLRSVQHLPESLWLGGVSGYSGREDIDAWLESHGLSIGNRYPHTQCPIDPSDTAAGDPVQVNDNGIYCHRCAGKGLSLGSRTPGFASWPTITGNTSISEMGEMIRGRVHWGHAKHTLVHKYRLPEAVAKLAYSAALKLSGCPEELVSLAFHRDTDDLARVDNLWMNLESSYTYQDRTIRDILGALPSVQVETEKGWKASASAVAYHQQGHALSSRGYRNIELIQGHRLAERHLPPPPKTLVPVYAAELKGTPFLPRYRERKPGRDLAWAEAQFERVWPGLQFNLLRCLLCAAGVAQETRLGMPPLVFIAGASGAGKTTITEIACGILGSAVRAIQYAEDERLKQAIREGGSKSALVVSNEFLKDGARKMRKWNPRVVLETILTMTPATSCHQLYVGPKELGRVPAFIITEPECPESVRNFGQIARRLRYAKLPRANLEWGKTIAEAGLTGGGIHLFRLKSPVLAEAADLILSDVIDRYFCLPMTWDEMADECGVSLIKDSTEFVDDKKELLRFFELVCDAPEITDQRMLSHYPNGWKVIKRQGDTEQEKDISDAYSRFAQLDDWGRCDVLTEKDWPGILSSPYPVRLDHASDGQHVFVRFSVGPKSDPTCVNREVLT